MSLDPRFKRIVLASGNPGKLREFRDLLGGLGIELVPQSELGIEDAEETGLSFVENALIKARHASRISGLPALADDSGLCVDALGGAPGLYSARYAGAQADSGANIAKLLDAMREIPAGRPRQAHFVCVLALLRSVDDPDPVVTSGRWHGRITEIADGSSGFGYDPVFFDPEAGITAAGMPPQVKHRRSHRGTAMSALLRHLAESSS
jgi:XTP/dITP diphosphohydrolase